MKNFRKFFIIAFSFITVMVTFVLTIEPQIAQAISKPRKAIISSVKSNSTTAFTVKWKKVSGAKGYQIRYSKKASMTGAKKLLTSAKKKKIKKLKAGSKYYVQVRAYKKSGVKKIYGPWSKKKKVITNYSIKYVLNGGTQASDQRKDYAKTTATFYLKTPTREGYVFDGWYTSSSYKTKVTKIKKGTTGNKIFYAKWDKEQEQKSSESLNIELCRDKNISITLTAIENGHLVVRVDNKSQKDFEVGLSYINYNENFLYDEVNVTTTYAGKKRTIIIDDAYLGDYCFTGGQLRGRFYYYNNDVSEEGLFFDKYIKTSLPNNNTKPLVVSKTLLCEDANVALYKVKYEKNLFRFCIVNKSRYDYSFGFSYVEFGDDIYYDEVNVTSIYAGCEKIYDLDDANIGDFNYSSGVVSGRVYYYNDDTEEKALIF